MIGFELVDHARAQVFDKIEARQGAVVEPAHDALRYLQISNREFRDMLSTSLRRLFSPLFVGRPFKGVLVTFKVEFLLIFKKDLKMAFAFSKRKKLK